MRPTLPLAWTVLQPLFTMTPEFIFPIWILTKGQLLGWYLLLKQKSVFKLLSCTKKKKNLQWLPLFNLQISQHCIHDILFIHSIIFNFISPRPSLCSIAAVSSAYNTHLSLNLLNCLTSGEMSLSLWTLPDTTPFSPPSQKWIKFTYSQLWGTKISNTPPVFM